ncbi:MAG TPA: aquaporin, partial [Holophaga sp.]|nr:aquaporin [Holophaga sp.]
EIIATAVFVFLLGAVGSLTKGDGLSPIIVGSCIWGVGLSLGGPTGYALNPARDLGPRIAHALLPIPGKGPSDWGYAWIPVVGPMVGGAIGWVAWRCLSSLAAAG